MEAPFDLAPHQLHAVGYIVAAAQAENWITDRDPVAALPTQQFAERNAQQAGFEIVGGYADARPHKAGFAMKASAGVVLQHQVFDEIGIEGGTPAQQGLEAALQIADIGHQCGQVGKIGHFSPAHSSVACLHADENVLARLAVETRRGDRI